MSTVGLVDNKSEEAYFHLGYFIPSQQHMAGNNKLRFLAAN